ncbi:translocating chain-associated membrane protein 1 [Bacillus rossius redtenbacheri]|uniref:translocating chain-associated membrane protein 1 n=1 Tax=Bacillus rossius redtenbacheri TaxID=93214 RepID=UPI002FDEDFD7
MGIKGRKQASKTPQIFSHEFIIQNHADIVSCVAMIFVIGLMVQATSSFAYMFIAVHHNTSAEESAPRDGFEPVLYMYGWKDACAVFFYFLICIVMHAIVQEYILDKISRKLHLSKVKHSKFNESGQLVTFYVMSVLWGGDIIFRENFLLNIPSLWEGYPHNQMTFMFKFYFIIQMAYWLHCYPELYFQKTKREEMMPRIRYATLGFFYVLAAYLLNFTRIGICLLVLHYISEAAFHVARLIYFVDKAENGSKAGYLVANVVFVFVRLGSIIISVLTFWYGLSLNPNQALDITTGNFNTFFVRVGALAAVCLLQAWLMWNFITFHLKKLREQTAVQTTSSRKPKVEKRTSKKKKEEHKRNVEDDELPEVDQNTKKSLRNRSQSAKAK